MNAFFDNHPFWAVFLTFALMAVLLALVDTDGDSEDA